MSAEAAGTVSSQASDSPDSPLLQLLRSSRLPPQPSITSNRQPVPLVCELRQKTTDRKRSPLRLVRRKYLRRNSQFPYSLRQLPACRLSHHCHRSYSDTYLTVFLRQMPDRGLFLPLLLFPPSPDQKNFHTFPGEKRCPLLSVRKGRGRTPRQLRRQTGCHLSYTRESAVYYLPEAVCFLRSDFRRRGRDSCS